jgi:hypothetical protein
MQVAGGGQHDRKDLSHFLAAAARKERDEVSIAFRFDLLRSKRSSIGWPTNSVTSPELFIQGLFKWEDAQHQIKELCHLRNSPRFHATLGG